MSVSTEERAKNGYDTVPTAFSIQIGTLFLQDEWEFPLRSVPIKRA